MAKFSIQQFVGSHLVQVARVSSLGKAQVKAVKHSNETGIACIIRNDKLGRTECRTWKNENGEYQI